MDSRKGIIRELFKPARKNYPRLQIVVKGLFETLSIDLMDMQKYSKQNKGFKYIMTVCDNFSKYAWAIPLKSKTGIEVTAAMQKILDEKRPRKVKKLFCDEGKEFFNQNFLKMIKKRGVELYHTYSGMKSPIIERFNRTLRHMLHPRLMEEGNVKWIDILPEILDQYNNKVHRTIKMTPVQATDPKKEKEILKKVYRRLKIVQKRPKFKVGDYVRVSKNKLLFEKGYTQTYSVELYKIKDVKLSNPRTYILENDKGEEVKGRFYETELQKTAYPNVYLLEKVLKKKGNRHYVKFFGFDKPEWVNKNDYV